jgi:hypothetical protein
MNDGLISIVFYVAAGVIAILVFLFGFYIYHGKKKAGINYKLAISTINNFIIEEYGDKRGAKKKFCEEHDIRNHKSFIQAINPDSPIETPKIVAEALNKIGLEVELVNESIYKKKQV